MENQDNIPTPRMGINRPKRLSDLQSEAERMKEIQEKRRAIQEKLQREKPEKERQAALEKKAYEEFSPYTISQYFHIFSQLRDKIPFNGYQIDLFAAQAHLQSVGKTTLPVCKKTSAEIESALENEDLPLRKGPLKYVGLAREVIISSDGFYFEVQVCHRKQTLRFIKYTDPLFSSSEP